jgi:hypothetical protein
MGASVPTNENFRGGEWGSLWSGPGAVDEDNSEFDPVWWTWSSMEYNRCTEGVGKVDVVHWGRWWSRFVAMNAWVGDVNRVRWTRAEVEWIRWVDKIGGEAPTVWWSRPAVKHLRFGGVGQRCSRSSTAEGLWFANGLIQVGENKLSNKPSITTMISGLLFLD